MSAHTVSSTALRSEVNNGVKTVVVEVTGTASYDTGGSVADLSSHFSSKVYGAKLLAVSPHASGKYRPSFIPGSSYAVATGKVKLYDITANPGAEVTSTTDLSATTFTFEVTGR